VADKTTITPAFAITCNNTGIKPGSESTVGRTINDLKEKGCLPESSRISLSGRDGKLLDIKSRRHMKKPDEKAFIPLNRLT
jgi:hypothetical protein